MPERNDQPPAAVEDADFLDDDLDLDDLDELAEPEAGMVGADAPDLIDDDAADALLIEHLGREGDELEFEANGRVEPASLEVEDDGDIEDELDFTPELDLVPEPAPVSDEPALAASHALDGRVERLEAAAGALAKAEVAREGKRVKRKVSAATTGAGAVGAVPVLLQLAGAFDLSPELIAGISSAAAAIGALLAGWATPERKATLPTAAALDVIARR